MPADPYCRTSAEPDVSEHVLVEAHRLVYAPEPDSEAIPLGVLVVRCHEALVTLHKDVENEVSVERSAARPRGATNLQSRALDNAGLRRGVSEAILLGQRSLGLLQCLIARAPDLVGLAVLGDLEDWYGDDGELYSRTVWSYDEQGRVVRKDEVSDHGRGPELWYYETWAWNDDGTLREITHHSLLSPDDVGTERYLYDDADPDGWETVMSSRWHDPIEHRMRWDETRDALVMPKTVLTFGRDFDREVFLGKSWLAAMIALRETSAEQATSLRTITWAKSRIESDVSEGIGIDGRIVGEWDYCD